MMVRSDNKDDQRLCRKRFQKPGSLKLGFIGIKDLVEYVESDEVKHGTDNTEDHHKSPEKREIPVLGALNEHLVNTVCWKGNLGKVIDKVVEKDLNRQHREERQENGGGSHGKHVPEI